MTRSGVAFVCLVALAGCESVNSEAIQRWKTTEKGPGKLEDALRSSSVAPRLRAEAATALGEIGLADKVDAAMAAMPAGERWEILKSYVPLQIERLKDPSVDKAREARDALFSVRAHAPPEEQTQIDGALLPVIEREIRAGRVAGGRHSLDKMLTAIGPASAPMLVRAVQDPSVPYQGVVDLLTKVGDDASREQAGAALTQRAKAGPEVPPAMWRALGQVGGKTALEFLKEKAEKGFPQDAVAATQALQQRRVPEVLPWALKVAADGKAHREVRGEVFGVIEKIGGPAAQQGLVAIIGGDPDPIVRYRAYEAALEVGKGDALVPALEAFPAKASYKKDDVVDFLVKDITKLGAEAKPAVLRALSSPSPLARMTAVLALEAPMGKGTLGAADDAAALLKLSADKGTVKGFPASDTVGKEAARVAAVLKKG